MPADWSPRRVQAMQSWLSYKAEKRQSYTPRGFQCLVTTLARWSDDVIEKAVTTSMAQNWAGLFPERVGESGFGSQKKEGTASASGFPAAKPLAVPPEVAGWRELECVPPIYRGNRWEELPPALWAEIAATVKSSNHEAHE